ncbi:hypothetical protein NQ317_010298 [Molorchus minor]|uniref:Uncharacterized protein n=1 Tax=Molorchus minor TaxID=1323400 RepID=A0ABQ9JM92_9CUCU|nr:hypothetical protein NQ317_010298 [Molorchus minor]
MFPRLRVVSNLFSRIGGQQQGGVQVPQQVQMAVGRAVTNAAINELSNAFKFHNVGDVETMSAFRNKEQTLKRETVDSVYRLQTEFKNIFFGR